MFECQDQQQWILCCLGGVHVWLPDSVGTSQGALGELCATKPLKESIQLCHCCWAKGWGKALLCWRFSKRPQNSSPKFTSVCGFGAIPYESAAVKPCFHLFFLSVRWKTRASLSWVRKFHQQFLLLVDGPTAFPEQRDSSSPVWAKSHCTICLSLHRSELLFHLACTH